MGGFLTYGGGEGGVGAAVKISVVLLSGFRLVELAGLGGADWARAWQTCFWLSAAGLGSACVAGLWRSLRAGDFGGVL